MNRLQRIIDDRLAEKNLTAAEVARRGQLRKQTVYRLLQEPLRRMPQDRTLEGLAKGLELPASLLKDAAAESIGIRIYSSAGDDPDIRFVIATLEQLHPGRRKMLRRLLELMLEEGDNGVAWSRFNERFDQALAEESRDDRRRQ